MTGSAAHAQREEDPEPRKGFDKSKLFFGGNFGLSFSNYYTLVNVSPQVGYRFNDYLAAGVGLNFIYSSQKYFDNFGNDAFRYNYGVTGVNVFGRVYPIRQVFFQLQPELNYTWGTVKYYNPSSSQKLDAEIVPSLLGGAGGAIPAGGNGAFIILVQYDLLQQSRSPYGNHAFFSFGYNIGF
jgi:long-subunit fatty acid transport protein